ncbi:MAG: hypothetical protein J6X02_00270, partial [Bacilli bacterium]|nr:hypothetical protein [Bacilli bacterium]
MKKISYILIFVLTFLVTLTVNAKYKEFKAGDVVIINDQEYVIVENSNGSNSKLKVVDNFIQVSNYEELNNICHIDDLNDEYYSNIIKCVTDNAVICKPGDVECHILALPFDVRPLSEDDVLTYDENSEKNIGYFFKNKLDAYYKNRMGLTNIKVRMLSADDYINYAMSFGMDFGGEVISQIGQAQNSCSNGSWGDGNAQASNVKSSNPDGTTFTSNRFLNIEINIPFWINSLKYTEGCNAAVNISNYGTSLDDYYEFNAIVPVIEIEKADLEYALTKEVEGEGTLVLDAGNERDYEVGDLLIVAGQQFTIIGMEGEQLELLSRLPIGQEIKSSNCSNGDFQCYITNINYCTPAPGISSYGGYDGHEEKGIAKGGNGENVCLPLNLPYDFDDPTNLIYDPTDESNIGHYVKNELTEELKRTLGINNITVDVLKYQELEYLVDNCVISIAKSTGGNDGHVESGTRTPGDPQCEAAPSPIKEMYYDYLNSIMDLTGADLNNIDASSSGVIYPVVTLNYNDLPKYTRAGGNVSVKATPAEGWELVELKVTKYENEKVNYTPSEITPIGESNYSFVMPAADTHVFAKFVPMRNRFNALSRTMALVVSEGQNRVAGDKVKFNITLEDGETLEKIVYYDVNNNEIEIEYEKVS